VTSSWFFLSTLNYDARSATHHTRYSCLTAVLMKIAVYLYMTPCRLKYRNQSVEESYCLQFQSNSWNTLKLEALHSSQAFTLSLYINFHGFAYPSLRLYKIPYNLCKTWFCT